MWKTFKLDFFSLLSWTVCLLSDENQPAFRFSLHGALVLLFFSKRCQRKNIRSSRSLSSFP